MYRVVEGTRGCSNVPGQGAAVLLDGLGEVFRDALLVTLVASVVGLFANLVHPGRIPFFAEREYSVLVPCPEPGGAVMMMRADDPLLAVQETFLVDARSEGEYARWKLRGAVNVPFDYLDPTPRVVVENLAHRAASSRAQRVVVYGDGDEPDSGEQLGKEISGRGIKNVLFVLGGAPALATARGEEGEL